jgi:uncharacterized protein
LTFGDTLTASIGTTQGFSVARNYSVVASQAMLFGLDRAQDRSGIEEVPMNGGFLALACKVPKLALYQAELRPVVAAHAVAARRSMARAAYGSSSVRKLLDEAGRGAYVILTSGLSQSPGFPRHTAQELHLARSPGRGHGGCSFTLNPTPAPGPRCGSGDRGSLPFRCFVIQALVTSIGEQVMDGMVLAVFLFGTFLGGLTSGLAGFAMGLVVSGVWLHVMAPLQTATLIVGFGLVTQGYALWKLRGALDCWAIAPFILGGAFGVPVGTMMLTVIDPGIVRSGIGGLLIAYSVWGLAQRRFKPIPNDVPRELAIGGLNGLLGGITGLTGIIATIWCQLIGLPKDKQRAIFQPVNLVTIVMSAIALSFAGAVTPQVTKLYLLGLPTLLAGLWCGFKLYGKLDDIAFRKVVLLLLLVSGGALLAPVLLRLHA